jgi:hypothetical protein
VFLSVSENAEVISRFGIDDHFVYAALKDHACDALKGVFKASPLLFDRRTVFMKLGFGLGLRFFSHGAPCDSIDIVFYWFDVVAVAARSEQRPCLFDCLLFGRITPYGESVADSVATSCV